MFVKEVKLKVYAKINLSLNVTGFDGSYHMLDSVFASVDIYDVVCAKKRSDGVVNLSFDGGVKIENSNAYRAAILIMELYGGCAGADITITRNIPTGKGLGGSSADAAGVIRALDKLYNLNLNQQQLIDIAKNIGSDVPFMLFGGYARIIGNGSNFYKIESDLKLPLTLIAKGKVSTKECFAVFDNGGYDGIVSDNDLLVKALTDGDVESVIRESGNALTDAAISLCADVKNSISFFNKKAVMTGSGAAVYCIGYNTNVADSKSNNKSFMIGLSTQNYGIEFI